MNKLPPLEDIRVFSNAVRLGSFTATARQLGVSPAYVSKRIARLEQTLGVPLLLRSARHMTLTAEGRVALEWGEQMLDAAEQMSQEIGQERRLPRGRIRLVTSTGFGSHRIAPLISRLVGHYPELEVDLELLDRPVDVISEGFDLELRVGGTLPPHLIARRLAENHRILCAAPSYLAHRAPPRTPADLARHRCIGIRERDQSSSLWRLHGPDGINAVSPSTPLTTNNGAVARQWCLDGQGILLRSIWNVADDLKSGRLVQVLPEYRQPAAVYALYPTRLETSARLRSCVDFLAEHLTLPPAGAL